MKKNATKHWPIWVLLLFVVSVAAVAGIASYDSRHADASGGTIFGMKFTDNGQSAANCAHVDQDGPLVVATINAWTGWFGDSDSYQLHSDPDCVRLYLAGPIPADTDFRIALQARDSIACGFLDLFQCGDGGGTVVYGPWVSADASGKAYTNSWTGWATDADGWDPDQWRFLIQASSTAWYGHTASDYKVGVQAADANSGAGCSQQIDATQYTASSTAGGGWSPWAHDTDAQNFNCLRINLVATSTLDNPTAIFIGTSTAPYGDTINLPWNVDYINTSVGCTLVGSGATADDRSAYPIKANGVGSTTTVPIIGTETYTLTCTGLKPGSSVVATKIISTIAQPASLEFNMSPTSGLIAGDTATSTITAINAASCTLVGKDLDGNTVDPGFTYAVPGATYVAPTIIDINAGSSWTVPDDWNSSNNTVEVVAGGGGGNTNVGGAGGGGGYSKITNLSLTPGSQVSYGVGGGGSGSNGSAGGDTWFGATTMANCVTFGTYVCVGAQGGRGGTSNSSGGAGGQISAGVGTIKYSGGNGGAPNGGGGGAAGPHGNGNGGGNCTNCGGGSGDAGHGGGGGGGGGGAGGAGTEWKINKVWGGSSYIANYGSSGPSAGSGGGGGGSTQTSCGFLCWNSGANGGSAGSYGAGGGGSWGNGSGGSGKPGRIFITYAAPADAADAHIATHTVNVTTDYTVTCTPSFTGEPDVTKTVRVTLNSCALNGVPIADGGSDNFYSASTPPLDHTCSEYGPAVRTCNAGVLGGDPSYKYASCIDQSGLTITANGISPTLTVRKGTKIALSWDGGNSDSCTVSGSDGYNGHDADGTTPISATREVTINQKTIYTINCTLGQSMLTGRVTVNILPAVIEI